MNYLKQTLIIFAAYFLGEAAQRLLHLPVPGSVLGLVILFAALYSGLVRPEMIEGVSRFLLRSMGFFFVPAGAGLMVSAHLLHGQWLAFLLTLVISTAVVWVVTAGTVKRLRGRE